MFGRKKKYNDEVSALLPVLGIDFNSAGDKSEKVLSMAWKEGYSVHEAALFVAYNFLGYLGKNRGIRAALDYIEFIQPTENQWVNEDAVHEQYPRRWRAAIDQTMDGALLRGITLGRVEVTPNMPDIEDAISKVVLRGNVGVNGEFECYVSRDVKAGIESMGLPSPISYPFVALYLDDVSGVLLSVITIEIGPPNVPMLCMFNPDGSHDNFGERQDITEPRQFVEEAYNLFRDSIVKRYKKVAQDELDRISR